MRIESMKDTGGQSPKAQPERGTAFRVATVMASIVAIASLAVDYGFRSLPNPAGWTVRFLEVLCVAFFIGHTALRVYWATNRLQHIRGVWYELVLIGSLAAGLGGTALMDRPDHMPFVLLTLQIALFLFLFIRLTELLRLVSTGRLHPAQIFVASFAGLIALGTGLLMLPAATSHIVQRRDAEDLRGNIIRETDEELIFQDGNGNQVLRREDVTGTVRAAPADLSTALFTSTSAVCVTGLVVESTGGYWSPFGQTVILVLIQLGGLGIMTFGAVFAILLWQSLGLRQSAVMKDMIGPAMSIDISRVLIFILASTACFEAVGIWSIWTTWSEPGMAMGQRAFYSLFHAVSAFCNAGFGLYDNSLENVGLSWQANLAFPMLILLGGLGFMVIYNLSRIVRCHLRRLWQRLRGHMPRPELGRRRLTLQSKLVLVTTLVLLVGGAGLVWAFESMPACHDSDDGTTMTLAGPLQRLTYSWFQSVTARTAGFSTSPTDELTDSSKFLTVVLMFVGASPGSTGGGIKTATFAVILCGIWSLLRNRPQAQAFHRTIPQSILIRSLVILTLGTGVVVTAAMMVSVTQPGIAFLDALFESTSAFGTVGLSTGVTSTLNPVTRLLIMAVMFIGRVGPLTLFIALPLGVRTQQYTFPTETVAIG